MPGRPAARCSCYKAGQRAKAVCCALYEADHAGEPVKVAKVLSGEISAYQDEINDYWGI